VVSNDLSVRNVLITIEDFLRLTTKPSPYRKPQLIASLTGLPTRLSISTSVSIVNLAVFLFTTSGTGGRGTWLIFHIGCYTFCIARRFEWDSEKNQINNQKHDGLGFESAARVFDDPHTIFRKDRIVAGEQRWHAIGMATGALLLVVHVYRLENEHDKEEIIRIISARQANKRERRIYIQQAAE
jgi:uncharacterized protein